MYYPKFSFEDVKLPKGDFQVKEVFETSTGSEPRD